MRGDSQPRECAWTSHNMRSREPACLRDLPARALAVGCSSESRGYRRRGAYMWCRCALVGLAACVPVPLSAQAPPATVDTIVVVNHNVFDADGDAPRFLTRLVNAVHVTTRPWVIRHALLVNPGDRYDSARAVESERALRARSEEHTSELQSRSDLVCRLLLEKKKT